MEEKNELNDIILSKSGSNSNSKKLLLAIAALTLILIIVLVIMNSLKTQSDEKPPVAAVPPAPSSPTEIVNDPLFEPVEVIQEGSNTTAAAATTPSAPQDLSKIAQKIKQESMQNSPAQENVVQSVPTPTTTQNVPVVQQTKSVPTPTAQVKSVPAPAPTTTKFAAKPVVNTPTIKTTKPTEVKKAAETKKVVAAAPKAAAETAQKTTEKAATEPAAKPAAEASTPKAAEAGGTYFIQVGSFTKEPSKALFDRLNASGLKYTTVPSGAATKVLVGPFQGEKAARDVLGNVKRNIESGAYIVKG